MPKLPIKIILTTAALSLLLHGGTFAFIASRPRAVPPKKVDAVKVRIAEAKPTPPPPPAPEPPPPPPPPPKPKEKKAPKAPTERAKPQPSTPQEPPKPVVGLDKNSFDPNGKGSVSAPMGNTMMAPDTGVRVKEAPAAFTGDLSSDAKIIKATVRLPEYTDDAVDAGFEGLVVVDVYVDAKGIITSAELRKKVGYGMDGRAIEAAKAVRFEPRKNKYGQAEPGWSEVKFLFQLP